MPGVADPRVRLCPRGAGSECEATPIPAPMSLPEPEFFRNFS